MVRVELTNVCNLRCEMCPQSLDYQSEKRFIDPDLFRKIVEQVSPYKRGSTFCFHISGEPLLHKDLPTFINLAEEHGFKTKLVTNATLLDRDKRSELLGTKLRDIVFSFEGFEKEEYERLRVGADYDKTWNYILSFLEENKSRRVGTELRLVMVPGTDLTKMREYAHREKHRFDHVLLSGYSDWLGKMSSLGKKSRYRGCKVLNGDVNILSNGNVIPCCMDVSGELAFGNMATQSYKEILSSPERQLLARRLRTGDVSTLICSKCAHAFGYNRPSEFIK